MHCHLVEIERRDGPLLESLLNIWQNVEPSLENFYMLLGTFSLLHMGKYGKINVANWSLWN